MDTKPKTAAGTPGIEFFHFCVNVLDKPPGGDSRSQNIRMQVKKLMAAKLLKNAAITRVYGGHQKYSLISPLNSISKLLIFKILSFCICIIHRVLQTGEAFNLVSQC